MVIYGTEQVSSEVIKINSSVGLAFFIRTVYLKIVEPCQIIKDAEFVHEKEEDILDAGMIFSVESKAMDYLARAEQCRAGLTAKLLKKNYQSKYIEPALNYLESINYIDDSRYALFWLNSRKINHAEARIKLAAELASRGIRKEDASKALDEFFKENSEFDFALKCYQKCQRQNKTPEKTVAYMLSQGFKYSDIKQIIQS